MAASIRSSVLLQRRKTLPETLESLERLSYPNYEVIVIDDGSKDDTAPNCPPLRLPLDSCAE